MPEVIVRKGEPVDRALKRLKNKLDSEGIMEEVRRLRAFETPTQKTKRKAKANAKRGKVKFRFNPNINKDKDAAAAGGAAPVPGAPAGVVANHI
jgi:small subunit ribosomal protein S21